MAKGKKRRVLSQGARDAIAKRRRFVERLDELIAKLRLLESRSTGTRKGTWALRRAQAEAVRARVKRAGKARPHAAGRTQYIVGGPALQGGAPGLKR